MIAPRLRTAKKPDSTIKPLFDARANSAMARSISPTLRTSIGFISIPKNEATAWITPNCAIPENWPESRSAPTRVTASAICLSNSGHLPARKLHYIVASRQPERNQWLAEFEDIDGFVPVLREPSPLNPAQKKTTIEV